MLRNRQRPHLSPEMGHDPHSTVTSELFQEAAECMWSMCLVKDQVKLSAHSTGR